MKKISIFAVVMGLLYGIAIAAVPTHKVYRYVSPNGMVSLKIVQIKGLAYVSSVTIASPKRDCQVTLSPTVKQGKLQYPSVNFAIFGWQAGRETVSGSIANAAVPGDGVSAISWEGISTKSCVIAPRLDVRLNPQR